MNILFEAIDRVVSSADDTGCDGDVTVVSKSAVDKLSELAKTMEREEYRIPGDTENCPVCQLGDETVNPDDPYYDTISHDSHFPEGPYPSAVMAWVAKAQANKIPGVDSKEIERVDNWLKGWYLMYENGNSRERATVVVLIERFINHLPDSDGEKWEYFEYGNPEQDSWVEKYYEGES